VAILEALLASRGNLSRAARALGIDRSTLRRKLRGVEGESLGKN
jgi:transcriptional regulator of acetoin/glycerol metabolism